MDFQVELKGECCLALALSLLVFPVNWIIAFISAGLFHEMCHALSVLLLRGKIFSIRIGAGGTEMEIQDMQSWKELLCAIAGPAGSLFLFLMKRQIPHVAVCALIQGIYNLFPVYPLDGGRAILCMLKMVYPQQRAEKICRAIQILFCVLILCVGVAAVMYIKAGIMPIIATIFLLGKVTNKYFLQRTDSQSTIGLPYKMR